MKKYLSALLVLLCTAGLLTGCVESDIGVTLNANETGAISATVGIEEDVYDQFVEMGATIFDGRETTTYEHDGKTYVAYTEVTEYKTFDEIEQALLDMTYSTDEFAEMESDESEDETDKTDEEDETEQEEVLHASTDKIFKSVEIEKEGGVFHTVYRFRTVLNPQTSEEDNEAVSGMDSPLDAVFHMTFRVEMPEKISEASGGTVEDNRVTFEIDDLTETAEFSAVSDQPNILAIAMIVLVLVILLIAFAVCLKRKNNA